MKRQVFSLLYIFTVNQIRHYLCISFNKEVVFVGQSACWSSLSWIQISIVAGFIHAVSHISSCWVAIGQGRFKVEVSFLTIKTPSLKSTLFNFDPMIINVANWLRECRKLCSWKSQFIYVQVFVIVELWK
jgi:hypothetical protein